MADAKRRGDPAYPSFTIEDSPFYWIARVSGRYVLDMEAVLKTIGMDIPRWRTLMIVREREPSSVSEIAETAAMRLSTMTRVVQRLAAGGLVRLASRASDARKTDVYLTAAGRAAAQRVREIASRVYRQAFADFTAEEIRALNRSLVRVFRNLAKRPGLPERLQPLTSRAPVSRSRRFGRPPPPR
jgi:DNA-binding MarR family transcriptional regulator